MTNPAKNGPGGFGRGGERGEYEQVPPGSGGALPTNMVFNDHTEHYPERSKARTVRTLGLIGLVFPLLAPFAWIMGAEELRAQRAERRDPRNFDPAHTGMWLGILSTLAWSGFWIMSAFGSAI